MKKQLFASAFILFAVFAASCEKKNADRNSEGKVNVITTIFPLYDFARAASKERASIAMLAPPGNSVHSFEPSPADVKKIQEADMFLYIGGEGDAWIERIIGALDTSKIKVVRLFDFVKLYEEDEKEGMQAEKLYAMSSEDYIDEKTGPSYDEHIWTSPKNAAIMISAITEAFCEKDFLNCESYKENSKGYVSQIEELSVEMSHIISYAKRKKIIVADRFPFRYLTEEYGLEYTAAFPGCDEYLEPSAATIAHLIDVIKNDKIPYIYHMEQSSQNTAKVVSWQTGAKMLQLHSYHNISKYDFEKGTTYLDLMKQNTDNLKIGLWAE